MDSTEQVDAQQPRLTAEGLFADEERGTTWRSATQDKFWVTDPDGERWEHYTVLADSPPSVAPSKDGSESESGCCAR